MKTFNQLQQELRKEYLELREKMSKLDWALATLNFDDQEREMLVCQLKNMNLYSANLLDRIVYAKKRNDNNELLVKLQRDWDSLNDDPEVKFYKQRYIFAKELELFIDKLEKFESTV